VSNKKLLSFDNIAINNINFLSDPIYPVPIKDFHIGLYMYHPSSFLSDSYQFLSVTRLSKF